jgi:hypothetical protein
MNNKSGQYKWQCKHCTEGNGFVVKSWDNKHVKHLTDSRKCAAPANVQKAALQYLASIGAVMVETTDNIDGGPLDAPDLDHATTKVVITTNKKTKRKFAATLEGHWDPQMMETATNRAHEKLFQSVGSHI